MISSERGNCVINQTVSEGILAAYTGLWNSAFRTLAACDCSIRSSYGSLLFRLGSNQTSLWLCRLHVIVSAPRGIIQHQEDSNSHSGVQAVLQCADIRSRISRYTFGVTIGIRWAIQCVSIESPVESNWAR